MNFRQAMLASRCVRRSWRLWTLICFGAGIPVMSSVGGEKKDARNAFVISIPGDIQMEKVQISYCVTGKSGASSSEKQGADKGNTFIIPAEGGKTFEAVIYCPGYQFATIHEPSLGSANRTTVMTLKPLGTIHLSGRIAGFKPLPISDPVVDISYDAPWAMSRYIFDGRVPTFRIAVIPLQPDGSFSADVPDFYHDPVVRSFDNKDHAGFEFIVRSKQTWNISLLLSVKPDSVLFPLEIRPSYEEVVTFYGRKSLTSENGR